VESGSPTHSWGSAGPEGKWARHGRWVSRGAVGPGPDPRHGWVPGILVFMDLGAWLRDRYPRVVWVWELEADAADGGYPSGAWIWHSPSGGDPAVCGSGTDRGAESPAERSRWLCRPTGWGFGRPAIVLLDCGVEKPSMI
jgi:hypothetical protein